MEYNKLGKTDISVSKICLGTMTWGCQNTQAEAFEQMDYALEMGVNFWDTAEVYSVPTTAEKYGATETIIGNYFAENKNAREKVILATKVVGGAPWIRDGAKPTRESVLSAIETSLERLQTEYIDLYQVHWPVRQVNKFGTFDFKGEWAKEEDLIQETLGALDVLVKSGKVRSVGVSNETPWGVMEYLRHSKEQDLPRIVSIQNCYSLIGRSFDVSLGEVAMREQVGLLAYSPLAGGILSGKYLNGKCIDPKARFNSWGKDRMKSYLEDGITDSLIKYKNLAEEAGISLTELSLAWVNQRDHVTANIIGATNLEQLKENIGSIDIKLSEDVLEAIETIHLSNTNPGRR